MARFKSTVFFLFFIFFLSPSFLDQAWGEKYLKVTFLDVGEGDAIYIETPTKERVLIDTGNPATGYRVVEFLKEKGIDSLDAIFITHPHADHMGGIFQILPEFGVKVLYDNGQPIHEKPDCNIYRWYVETARDNKYKAVAAGDVFQFGDVKIHVIWPKSPASSDWNINSLVLRVVYGKVAFLLMGDANRIVEKALLEERVDLKAKVLKAGHHGAIDATSEKFLKTVSPEFAVISINEKNVRGYPHRDVLKRLKDQKVKTLTTFSQGNLTFLTDGINGVFLENKSVQNGKIEKHQGVASKVDLL